MKNIIFIISIIILLISSGCLTTKKLTKDEAIEKGYKSSEVKFISYKDDSDIKLNIMTINENNEIYRTDSKEKVVKIEATKNLVYKLKTTLQKKALISVTYIDKNGKNPISFDEEQYYDYDFNDLIKSDLRCDSKTYPNPIKNGFVEIPLDVIIIGLTKNTNADILYNGNVLYTITKETFKDIGKKIASTYKVNGDFYVLIEKYQNAAIAYEESKIYDKAIENYDKAGLTDKANKIRDKITISDITKSAKKYIDKNNFDKTFDNFAKPTNFEKDGVYYLSNILVQKWNNDKEIVAISKHSTKGDSTSITISTGNIDKTNIPQTPFDGIVSFDSVNKNVVKFKLLYVVKSK
ncbi:MAG: hypothetical protein A2086_09830 [Spirochaetes bacterium GWD1_27_9]|nr:MAG: hypothetical protein A2Z98_08595 [Spirochaetes bacterium GWB1_27_13]OHD26492.1 MAG: hypothetical protein A2Y34_12830 [Spirochaetes bacterium GWC1_27_15]OHD42034.1 MAG: hypothetical protein A2086_09830 [Spirochaetes bacterium GWD1_27_9]